MAWRRLRPGVAASCGSRYETRFQTAAATSVTSSSQVIARRVAHTWSTSTSLGSSPK
jgi:hypothetical protein